MSYSIINLVNRQYKSITGNTLILLLMLRQTKRETRISKKHTNWGLYKDKNVQKWGTWAVYYWSENFNTA